MTEWEWTHAAIGGLASVIFLFQTLGTADTDRGGADFDADGPMDVNSFGGSQMALSDFLSVRNFVAFFIGYGWITFVALLSNLSRAVSSLLGVLAGLVFIAASLMLIKTFLKLQEDGSLRIESLVGKSASVYIEIGARGSTPGKIMIDTRKGRQELTARTDSAEKLQPGAVVKVVGTDGGVLWVVADDKKTSR